MAVINESILKEILDAPVGRVESTIRETFGDKVNLKVVEQNKFGTMFVRKIVITYQDIPILLAEAKFQDEKLPKIIRKQLLERKKGIGAILIENKIQGFRKNIISKMDSENGQMFRDYDITVDGSVWFQIKETILTRNCIYQR